MKAINSLLNLQASQDTQDIKLTEKIRLKQCQGEKKLFFKNDEIHAKELNPTLVKAISRAFVWNQMLLNREVKSISQLSRKEGISCRYIRHILPLCSLSPKVIDTILEGRQHPKTTITDLLQIQSLPWSDQSVL